MDYKTILVAVDTTDEAEQVVDRATKTASENATLYLLTVVEPLSSVYGSLVWSPALNDTQSLEDSLVARSKKRLETLSDRFDLDINNSRVEIGSAAQEIRAMADEISADLIVLGTHGRHGLGLLLGSTANSVLHGVNTDVLVVRLQ